MILLLKGVSLMKKEKSFRRPLWWLFPVVLTLPVAAVILLAASKYGQTLVDAMSVAMKMVVIP